MLGRLGSDEFAHFRHHLIVGDAGFFGCHGLLDLGSEPCVIGRLLFGRLELGLDGREFGHGV